MCSVEMARTHRPCERYPSLLSAREVNLAGEMNNQKLQSLDSTYPTLSNFGLITILQDLQIANQRTDLEERINVTDLTSIHGTHLQRQLIPFLIVRQIKEDVI
jgi:hypothetical protein